MKHTDPFSLNNVLAKGIVYWQPDGTVQSMCFGFGVFSNSDIYNIKQMNVFNVPKNFQEITG